MYNLRSKSKREKELSILNAQYNSYYENNRINVVQPIKPEGMDGINNILIDNTYPVWHIDASNQNLIEEKPIAIWSIDHQNQMKNEPMQQQSMKIEYQKDFMHPLQGTALHWFDQRQVFEQLVPNSDQHKQFMHGEHKSYLNEYLFARSNTYPFEPPSPTIRLLAAMEYELNAFGRNQDDAHPIHHV